jgi:hypothetical protein
MVSVGRCENHHISGGNIAYETLIRMVLKQTDYSTLQ